MAFILDSFLQNRLLLRWIQVSSFLSSWRWNVWMGTESVVAPRPRLTTSNLYLQLMLKLGVTLSLVRAHRSMFAWRLSTISDVILILIGTSSPIWILVPGPIVSLECWELLVGLIKWFVGWATHQRWRRRFTPRCLVGSFHVHFASSLRRIRIDTVLLLDIDVGFHGAALILFHAVFGSFLCVLDRLFESTIVTMVFDLDSVG